jgi:predicted Zn-dependent protease
MGAAASGVLKGLTLGVGNLIIDPKVLALRMQRKSHRGDADAFAIRAMKSAGYDPRAALALARRSVDAASAWPADADELKFDQERLERLTLLVN